MPEAALLNGASMPPDLSDADLAKIGADVELLAKFEKWDKSLEGHWGDWIEEAKECYRYVAGDQYTREQMAALDAGKKPHAVFNRIGPIIRAVVGAEIQGRQEIKYLPRTVNDTGFNELLTRGAEYLRDEGDADSEESTMKRDAFVCGQGWMNCRLEYDEDPSGQIHWDRLKPWEVLPDPSSRKANFRDARYIRWRRDYSREEFEDMWPGKSGGVLEGDGDVGKYTSDPRRAYGEGDEKRKTDDEVSVSLYQWFETESIALVAMPGEPELRKMPAEEYEELREKVEADGGRPPQAQIQRRRRYRYAFTTGKEILDEGDLPQRKFTLKAVTGEYDEEKGVYYGLVRPMRDPQMWANTFFNMILHIVKTNAKGGVMAEKGAVDDVRKFETSWAASDSISWVANGAMQNKRIQPKDAPAYPATIDSLLERAIEAIRETSGVNAEILGLVDREQPGVLEAQRKQAAYGILAPFFESFKRYQRSIGELLIDYMRSMDSKLVRVAEDSGVEKYVPLIFDDEAVEFDVIVDEAPAGPNQKQQTFAVIQAMLPILREADLPLDVWMELMKYSPLPETLIQKIITRYTENAEMSPEEQKAAIIQNLVQQLQLEGMDAENKKKQAEAGKITADTESTVVETINLLRNPDPKPQSIL